MKPKLLLFFVYGVFMFFTAPVNAENDQLSLIESRLKAYYEAIAKKDVNLAISFYHPDSLAIERAKDEIAQFSQQFDISYKISEVKEIGRADSDIVVSYVEETTFSASGGKKLNTFTAKVLMVWRKDQSGAYKIWDSLSLTRSKAEHSHL